MSLKMVKLPSSSSSSSSSSDSNILTAKPQTRSKKRLLPKYTGQFEISYSEPPYVSKTKPRNVWQLFSEISPKKRNRRQNVKPSQKKKVPATVTHQREIIEEEMEDLIIEDDNGIEVMRDVSATTFPSPKRSEKFSNFLQKFNKSSRKRKEFKSPRPVKRKCVRSDHKPIPELDDLEYDVFEDINSPECLKEAETATGVSIQYEIPPKYLQDSPSIPVGLSRKFLNSTAVDGHQNNLLELTQDISVITSGSSKQTSAETTPSRFPALHTGNKRRKKSANYKEEKKKPASSTRLFQTNDSDLSIPDLSSIIHLTGRQLIQAEDKNKSRNKRKSSIKSEDAGEVIENRLSPLSLIKIIADKTLINKQSTFRQGDGIHPEAEFGISSIKEDDDDDDDFLQPKSDTRYINSKDFYQTYDIEEIEVPDVICIDDEEDEDLVSVKTSMKHGDKSQNISSVKQNEDQSTIEYDTNNNSISGEGSSIVEKLLNRKSSKLSKTAQTILEVASPGIRNTCSMHNSCDGSTLVAQPSKGNSSTLSKTAQTILEVASPGIRDPKINNTFSRDDSETLLEKPLEKKSSKIFKTAQTIFEVAFPVIGDFSKNRSMAANSVNSSKDHHKSLANIEGIKDSCTMKDMTVKSRRQSTNRVVEKEISLCCLQTLKFPPPMKVLISQKTIPNGKRFTTEIQTASADILGKAVPPPKGISKVCRRKRSMYYFKDVKRYERGK